MSRRFQFSVRALLAAMLAVACFFGGVRVERERQRREDHAAEFAAKNAERAALARIELIAAAIDLDSTHVAFEGEARERINRELFLQEQRVDLLMDRFNALMAEEQRRARLESAESETGESIREFLKKFTR
jgi:hypothetical protein